MGVIMYVSESAAVLWVTSYVTSTNRTFSHLILERPGRRTPDLPGERKDYMVFALTLACYLTVSPLLSP